MRNFHYFLMGLLSFLLLCSCQKEDIQSCDDKNEINIIPFEIIPDSLFCSLQNLDSMSGSKQHKLIETQEDFEKYVFCLESLPQIDFSSHFIIGGKIFSQKCAWISDIQFINCSVPTLKISVDNSLDGGVTCGAEVVLQYLIAVNKRYSRNIKYIINEND